MPDIASSVTAAAFTGLPSWRALVREFEAGDVPHCRAVSAPLAWHEPLLEALAGLYLTDRPDGGPVGEERLDWEGRLDREERLNWEGHPDLFVAGEAGKAPNIEACRSLIRDLALKPARAVRRLGVVMAADRLLLPAANSLLKLAEEPPSHACVLFLLEGNALLPTLRSRARFTALAGPMDVPSAPPPQGDAEWLRWVEEAKDPAGMAGDLAAWSAHAFRSGDVERAARIERLRVIAEAGKLSVPALCDLLTLALREELPFEHLFGDFR